jgi:hypothetical protein
MHSLGFVAPNAQQRQGDDPHSEPPDALHRLAPTERNEVMTVPSDEEIVRLRLNEAALPARDDEIERLAQGYPNLKAMIGLLWSVEAARYESPALGFNPTPVFADWA